jgi:hypothetical protein
MLKCSFLNFWFLKEWKHCDEKCKWNIKPYVWLVMAMNKSRHPRSVISNASPKIGWSWERYKLFQSHTTRACNNFYIGLKTYLHSPKIYHLHGQTIMVHCIRNDLRRSTTKKNRIMLLRKYVCCGAQRENNWKLGMSDVRIIVSIWVYLQLLC